MTVSVPIQAITDGPTVMWNHIDGPLLEWAGHMHWLTWRERFAIFWKGVSEINRIAERRWPYLADTRRRIEREGE